MFKNVASQKVVVFAFDATTNLPKTGDAANITAYIAKDFGSVTQLGDTSATEMDATNAKGYYLFDITQTETNADMILVSAKSSTANIVVVGAPAAIFTFPTTGILAPATAGRTLVVDANGLADANTVKVGPTGSGTAQTAGDIISKLPTALVSGRMDSSVGAYQTGLTPLQPTTAGRTLDVSTGGEAGLDWANIGSPSTAQNLSGTSTKAVEPTVAGRTLDVSAGGEAGLDWANIGSPTTTQGLSGTTIKNATDVLADTDDIQSRLPAALTANGNLKVSVLEFLTTALTETVGGQITAAFKKFFDKGTPTGTINSIPDAVAGAAGGIAIVGSAMSLGPNTVDAAALAADAGVEIGTAVWAATTRFLTGNQGIRKNVALAAFPFRMTDSTNHAPATGLTVTSQRSINGGAFANCSNTATAIGNGWYKIDLTAGDLNGDTIALKFTATGADQCDIAIVTAP